MAVAVSQLGRHDDEATTERSTRGSPSASTSSRRCREQVRTTPLEDPEQWPVYGSLISDSLRAVAELESARESAVVPTDTGPAAAAADHVAPSGRACVAGGAAASERPPA